MSASGLPGRRVAARRAGTARGSLETWGREFARRVGVPYGDEREAVA